MRAAEPARAGDFASDALHGAVAAGILILVFQQILLELLDAFPKTAYDGSTILMFSAALITMSLLPVLSTVISLTVAYTVGGVVGAGLYVVMSIAASAMLGAPLMGLIVLLVATVAMALWLFIQSYRRSHTGRRGFR